MADTHDTTIVTRTDSPESSVRINVSKTGAGWRYETTVSLRWIGGWNQRLEVGDGKALTPEEVLDELNCMARREAMREIAEREWDDAKKAGQ